MHSRTLFAALGLCALTACAGESPALLTEPLFAKGGKGGGGTTCSGLPRSTSSLVILPGTANIAIGNTVDLGVVNQSGVAVPDCAVTWSSDQPLLAEVTNTGLVTGVAAGGPVTIRVSTSGKKALVGTATIVVTRPPIATIEVTPSSSELLIGESVQLSAVAKDVNNQVIDGVSFTFSTGNADIAGVSGTGLVTAAAPGTTTIFASAEGKDGSASVAVDAPLSGKLLVVKGTVFSDNRTHLLTIGGRRLAASLGEEQFLYSGGFWGALAPDYSFTLQGNLPFSDKMQRRDASNGWAPVVIFGTGARDYGAHLSQDGTKVVWFRESVLSPLAREIWIGNPNGTNAVQLTSDNEFDNVPAISPNNQRIVWSKGGTPRNLWIMNADGSGKTQLTFNNSDDLPRFSPDGSRIVFVSSRTGVSALYIMDSNGTNVRKLPGTDGLYTPGVAGEVAPLWSPDGHTIVFNGKPATGVEGIYVIPADGSRGPERLRNNGTAETAYDWR